MRLIDAEKLKENCKITGELINNFQCVDLVTLGCVIDNQPTAYDVDKVVAELEKSIVNVDDGTMILEFLDGYEEGILAAIQIVNGGGVDGNV